MSEFLHPDGRMPDPALDRMRGESDERRADRLAAMGEARTARAAALLARSGADVPGWLLAAAEGGSR